MKTIFFDVDTQNDFMNKDGALYVPDAKLIKPNLGELTHYATSKRIPRAGSVDRHFGTEEYKDREGELARFEGPFPDHCMDNTFGQWKILETTRPHYFTINHPHYLDGKVDEELLKKVINNDPLLFEKQSFDVFTNPAIEKFLDMAKVEQAVVYGVATDYCVQAAVLGMQKRGIQCYVVEDAIKAVNVNPGDGEKAIEEMKQAGAKFVTTKQVLEDLVK